ncbi:sporulation stage III protein AG [Thermohalobacter berrensis]|uniref:Stage III sporulation protein AG n=1 Tax=Thermohalobacter berrensis TaxID=99594 RepID=A0A419TAT2_9FIRM|nr:sporulation stage III protein AG [Thermohalobacter berrensis]RKD34571.1 hypothetical protein BET03_01725 [Thermohalobacter berrensis]
MNFFDKFKNIFNKEESNKVFTTIITVFSIGLIILIGVSTFIEPDNNAVMENSLKGLENENINKDYSLINNYTSTLESKLETVLSQIKGVGQVEVMITLYDSAERIPAVNTTKTEEKTKEKDSQGGVREVIKQDYTEQVVVSNQNNDSLVVIKEVKPKVKGVIVVAEGAEDLAVKEKLYTAVKTVLGISGNRVEIYPKD